MHESVLLQSALDGLSIEAGDVFVDATLGAGGHSTEVCRRWGSEVELVGIDVDTDALDRSVNRVRGTGCDITRIHGNFRHIDALLRDTGVGRATKILYDLGWSSEQLDASGRGFSFRHDEPLTMTLDPVPDEGALTAREIVNEWDEENIAAVLTGYGEERYARRIARYIVETRENNPIETTFNLVGIIEEATPRSYQSGRLHAARRTFQALRIAVNDELEALRESLHRALLVLEPGGRIAVISFHSLEDRIVKRFMRTSEIHGAGVRISKRPITASDAEVNTNPRARSAKLRIFEKKQ